MPKTTKVPVSVITTRVPTAWFLRAKNLVALGACQSINRVLVDGAIQKILEVEKELGILPKPS